MRRYCRRRRRGYVLIMTLAVLVLATTVMVGVSRAALHHANAARDAQDELQRRYGSASIRAALLGRAESVLALAEAAQGRRLASTAASVQLGSRVFDVVVSDEQAKANVNRMLETAVDRASLETRLREAMTGTGLGRTVRLRPAADNGDVGRQRVTGIGQVFDLTQASPERLLDPRTGALHMLTIWGDGRVNVRRASPAAARLALTPPLSAVEVARLLDGRPSLPRRSKGGTRDPLGALLESAGVASSIGGRSVPVTLSSDCHAVWITCDDGRRSWREVEVLDMSEKDSPKRSYFAW
jgi:hypothetical protein